MSKIDFHCHTKAIKKNEKETRNVTKDYFIDAMIESDVKYVAITNHNHFDLKQYDDFCDNKSNNTKNKILIFPGIEIDVCNDHISGHPCKFKQINVIIDPKYKINFYKCVDNYYKNDINKVMSFEQIKNMFNKYDPIYFLDFKNKKRKFDENNFYTFKEIINDINIPIILDVNNIKSQFVLIAQNEKVLIGSDVMDWNFYKKESKKLSDLVFNIENYEKLRWLFKEKCSIDIIQYFYSSLIQKDFDIEIKKDKFKIKIFSGLNLIFGGKGTGKSLILEQIEKNVKDKNFISYYSPKSKDEYYKKTYQYSKENNYIDNDFILNEYDMNFISNINNSLDYIKKINVQNINKNIVSFNEWYNIQSLVSRKNWILQNAKDINIDPNIEVIINKNIENINKNYQQVFYLYNQLNIIFDIDLNSNNKYFKNIISQTKVNFKFFLIELNKIIFSTFLKQYLINKFINKFLSTFKECFAKNGELATITSIGLLKKCKDDIEMYNKLKILYDLLINNTNNERIWKKDIYIPNKGDIKFMKKINFWHNDIDKEGFIINNKSIIKNKSIFSNLLKFLKLFKKKPFQNFYNNGKKLEKINFILQNDLSALDFIWVSWIFEKNNKPYLLSSGEEEYLVLMNEISNENFDYYLLDEPALFIGSSLISSEFINKIANLKRKNKKIIIITHNALVGLNTFPINMIYREYDNKNDKYHTYYGNILSDEFISIDNKENKYKFRNLIMKHFEGGFDFFRQRWELYELNNRNKK